MDLCNGACFFFCLSSFVFRCDVRLFDCCWYFNFGIWRVSDQNGVSPLYIMLEIHHSGREPLIFS